MEKPDDHRFILITYPRTASNLLVKVLALEEQPNVVFGNDFFLPAILLSNQLNNRTRHIETWSQEEQQEMQETYQACFDKLQAHIDSAESAGKMPFIKEHSYFMAEPVAQTKRLFGSSKKMPWVVKVPERYGRETKNSSLNETVIPDEVLGTLTPIFLIRHPALAFPSDYRTARKIEGDDFLKAATVSELGLTINLHWTRSLFDWYSHNSETAGKSSKNRPSTPLILDADDILASPDVIIKLCKLTGLDPEKLRFEWAPTGDNDLNKTPDVVRIMLSTLSGSSGILKNKSSEGIDIDAEVEKWKEEFGNDQGEKIKNLVWSAMPDYEFLKEKRIVA